MKTSGADAVRLLDREVSAEYLAQWTAHVATERKTVQQDTRSVVIFRIDKEWFAISAEILQEVMGQFTVRTLPGARSSMIRGLVNIRGELLLCIALEVLLGIGSIRPRTAGDRLLIFSRDRFAVPVSEVYGLHKYHPGELRPAPAVLRKASSGSFTSGILPWRDGTVACLDEGLLLYALNKGLA
jgi:chemotaxis-related protein WspD